MKILVVEDDVALADLLAFAIRQGGFDPLIAHDSPSALRLLQTESPDLVALDIGLGQWDGLQLLEEIRHISDVRVILMTGKAMHEEDKVRGLDLGADDYLLKPFSCRELLARIRAHTRRRARNGSAHNGARELRVGSIALNLAEHAASKSDEPLRLSVTEFRLLHYLMRHAGSVVATGDLLREVWGYDERDPAGGEVIRVALHRLRRKLEDEPAKPRLLQTIPGVGVMLKVRSN